MNEFLLVFAEVLRQSLFIVVPLIIVALAGLFSERSGVVNIALEGIMTIGAVFGIYATNIAFYTESGTPVTGMNLFYIGLIVAVLAGIIFSLLHAYASIHMKANQIISGTALNLFAPAFGIFIAKLLLPMESGKIRFPKTEFYLREVPFPKIPDIPVIGDLMEFIQNAFFTKTYPSLYIGFIVLIISYIVLYKTRFGLRLRSCGENPQASDAAGINVYKMRYTGVIISGGLAGMGGYFLFIPISSNFDPSFGAIGVGFLALAVMISGQWKPSRILLFAFIFGFTARMSDMTSIIPFLKNLQVSSDFSLNAELKTPILKMVPFIVTLVVLVFTSRNSAGPKAAGEPYDAGKR